MHFAEASHRASDSRDDGRADGAGAVASVVTLLLFNPPRARADVLLDWNAIATSLPALL